MIRNKAAYMIRANELRIGNWVGVHLAHIEDAPAILKDISVGYVQLSFIDGEDNDEINPIPLTPEILEKCGFVKKEGYEDYRLDFLTIMFRSDITACNNHGYLCNMEYFHQLQNLYFALTAEELEVNL